MPLPADMPPDVLIYRWFAATYQWTPAQVDELPLEALIWLPPIEMAAEDVARRARDRDARSAQAHRR